MKSLCIALAAALTLTAIPGWAQNEGPAVETSPVGRTATPQGTPLPRTEAGQTEGTVIVGDRESPLGLYIMPWRDSSASTEMDRPARLLTADMKPLDRPVFLRELAYYRALTGALTERNLVTPEMSGPAAESP